MKHVSIRVIGKVQGVFFRASTFEKANSLKLAGVVRNEADGSVYIEAEGDDDAIDNFIAWAKIGPPRADVIRCDIREGAAKNYSGFKILR